MTDTCSTPRASGRRRIPAGTGRAMAFASFFLAAASGAAASGLLGVTPVTEELLYEVDPEARVTLLLSRSVYPAEDGHLDAIVWLGNLPGAAPFGELWYALRDEDGRVLDHHVIYPVPANTVFFSLRLPDELQGRSGELEIQWRDFFRNLGSARASFSVRPPTGVPRSGRIPLTIPNTTGAVQRGVPMTVGVPFPRGALHDGNRVRLLGETGEEIPLQARVTATWSRFGSIKWLQCDFVADVDGEARHLTVEFGPDIARAPAETLEIRPRDGRPPLVHAGPVRFGDGIEVDAGDGQGFRAVLKPEALHGAFVEHENGRRFVLPSDGDWDVEEEGPVKALLRRRGEYRHAETGETFCRFDIRYDIRRGSPLVRILYTWIFTGYPYENLYRWVDGGRVEHVEGGTGADRIRNMGWRFELADPLVPRGFLGGTGPDAPWLDGDWLLQFDHNRAEISADGERREFEGRLPGVAAASINGAHVTFGVKDFWENFPNELEFADGAFFVHTWPRHGRPAARPVRIEDALRLWFAHEGELLDFALPGEWLTDEAFYEAAPNPPRRKLAYSQRDRRESVNAQGVAKTSEIWLLIDGSESAPDAARAVMEGLNDGTLRAVVDPAWMAESGAFYEMHPRDEETYPAEERVYELHARAPLTWVDRMGFYGKWIWGDMTWTPDPGAGTFGLYRGFRKSHQGWPYSWIPFARSGDPRFLRMADAATRYMTDVAFCHYSDERVPGRGLPEGQPRPRGFYLRFRIPWASHNANPTSRGYVDKCNYLWHSYYLTGYPRARDVALDWAHLTKTEGANCWGAARDCRLQFRAPLEGDARRGSTTLLQSYVETYEATFDPWFLSAAHQVARAQIESWRDHGWGGHFWNAGPREFHRFTGCPAYAEFYLAHARNRAMDRRASAQKNWAWNCGMIEPAAYAYHLTGDEAHLGELAFWLDYARIATYDGESDAWRGWLNGPMFTGYFLQYFPYALGAFARSGQQPGPALSEGSTFQLRPAGPDAGEGIAYRYELAVRKAPGQPVPLALRLQTWSARREPVQYRYRAVGPDGRTAAEGRWDINRNQAWETEIPADAPPGTYRLIVEGPGGSVGGTFGDPALSLPVSGHGVPEVLLLETGENLARSVPATQYWFRVPDGVEDFWIEFSWPAPSHRDGGRSPRFTVWDPDGKMAWDRQIGRSDSPGRRVLRAELPVAPEQAGRLWRLTTAGLSSGIALDPAIPRVFSTARDRWFEPE